MLPFGTGMFSVQGMFYMINPYCGWLLYQKWTKSTLCCLKYHNKHTKLKNIAILSTQVWHGAKWYFMYISNLITAPNMTKINPFFAETTNTQTVWKGVHNYSNLAHPEPNYILPTWVMHGTLLLYEIWTKWHHSVLRYHNKHIKLITNIAQAMRNWGKSHKMVWGLSYELSVKSNNKWTGIWMGWN